MGSLSTCLCVSNIYLSSQLRLSWNIWSLCLWSHEVSHKRVLPVGISICMQHSCWAQQRDGCSFYEHHEREFLNALKRDVRRHIKRNLRSPFLEPGTILCLSGTRAAQEWLCSLLEQGLLCSAQIRSRLQINESPLSSSCHRERAQNVLPSPACVGCEKHLVAEWPATNEKQCSDEMRVLVLQALNKRVPSGSRVTRCVICVNGWEG